MTTSRLISLPFDNGIRFLGFVRWTDVGDFFTEGGSRRRRRKPASRPTECESLYADLPAARDHRTRSRQFTQKQHGR